MHWIDSVPLVLSRKIAVGFLLLMGPLGACLAQDSNWAQFRGPTGQGVTQVALPTDLTHPSNLVWAYETQGSGWSSPVIANGQVWFTTAITQKASPEELAAKLAKIEFAQMKTFAGSVEFRAVCLDAQTGKPIHDVALAQVSEPEPINPLNSYASPTPVVIGGRVVCHFGNYGTWCLDTKTAKPLWTKQLVVDHSVGPGSSPIVHGNKVLIVCDGIDKQFVAALDLNTGELAWKTDRPPLRATNAEFKKAYSTPLLVPVHGKTIAVVPGAQWTVAYDPETGDEIWRVDCGDGFSTTPMPVFQDGLVVISTGYMRPEFVAIRPDGKGDVTKTHVAWRSNRGAPTMPSAIARNGKMYAISDSGILTVFNAATGEELNRARVGGNFSASPIMSQDHVYIASREGTVTIVRADDSLQTVASHDFESSIMASPAVIGNDIVLRTDKSVMRITSK